MNIQIDCYGFEATSEHFQKRKLEAFLIKNDAGKEAEDLDYVPINETIMIDRED